MEHYINKTRDFRPPTCDSLFITLFKPIKAVRAQRLAAGLTRMWNQRDLNSRLTAWHASTSRAVERGIASDLIKRATDWTGESRAFATFIRDRLSTRKILVMRSFYLKQIYYHIKKWKCICTYLYREGETG